MAKIVQAAWDVALFGNHNYLVLLDDNGNRVKELHGGPMNNGVFMNNATTGELYVSSNHLSVSWASDEKNVLAQGSMADMQNLFDAGQECALRINEKPLTYQTFGWGDSFNSNGVFRTLAACMNLDDIIADFNGSDPGIDEYALSWGEIDWVQRMFNIDDKGGPLVPEWPEEGAQMAENSPEVTAKLVGTAQLQEVHLV